MLEITPQNRHAIIDALIASKENYGGNTKEFCNKWKINDSVYSRIKGGERDGLIKDAKLIEIARKLGLSLNQRKWNVARTDVFNAIEKDVLFCQNHSKALMYVDETGTGKSFTAKYLSRNLKNCYYLDVSQCKTIKEFIYGLSREIGVPIKGTVSDIKAAIKYYLNNLTTPVVILDEVGDVNHSTLMMMKELWNGTENTCGWYLMGAEGFKTLMTNGMKHKRAGFRELFSRFSEEYTSTVPNNLDEKVSFYRKLISDVLNVNDVDPNMLEKIVANCLTKSETGEIGGLRRAESLLIINS